MGTFDDLIIDGINWQTKALGKSMHTFRPGDQVEVERVAGTDDPADIAGYRYDDLPRRYLVQVRALEYAVVEDGKLVGLATDADRAALIHDSFDYYGHDEGDQMRGVFDIPRPPRSMTPIPRGPQRPRRRPAQED